MKKKSSKRNVIIADSVSENQYLLKQILINYGYDTQIITDGNAIVDSVKTIMPDIILLNPNLNNNNIIDVCREIKNEETIKNIPVILINSFETANSKTQAFNSGAADYISTPFISAEVISRVKTHIDLYLINKKYGKINFQSTTNDYGIHEVNEKYKCLFDKSQDANLIIQNGKFVNCNQAAIEMLGFDKPEDLLSLPPSDFSPEFQPNGKTSAEESSKIFEIANQNGSHRFEWYHKKKNGDIFPVEVLLTSIITTNNYEFFHTVWRDISIRKKSDKALEESEKRLKDIIFNMSDWAWEVDKNGSYTYSSHRGSDYFGIKTEEIIGKTPFDFMLPDDAKKVSAVFIELMKDKKPIKDLENWNINKRGERFCFLTNGIPLFDANGNLTGYRGVDKDITKSKLLEESIITSLSLLEATLESIKEGILVVNNSGKVMKTNAKFAEIWNIPSKIISSNDDKILLNYIKDQLSDPEGFSNSVTELYNKPDIESSDIIYFKDGRILERISKPFFLDKKPSGRVWSFNDITERKKTEDQLRISKTHLQTLFQTIPDLVWLKDPNSIYLACNKKFEGLSGFKESEIKGKTDYDFFKTEDADFFRENDRKAKEAGVSCTNEEWLTFANDGHRALLEVIKTPMLNSEGELIGLLGIARDITNRNKAKNEIKQKNEELLKTNSEKDMFFSIIAHDLRSPFSTFLGLTQIMAEDLPNLTLEQIQQIAEDLKNSASKLFNLLENLLQWASSQQNLIPFNPELILLYDIVKESVSMVSEPAKIKNIEIVNDISEDMETYADRFILPTIIRNLVSNAVKFTNNGGIINISAKSYPDKTVEIAIRDSGIGMDESLIKDLFRLDIQTNRKGTKGEPSSGLGLLLCKEFIEKHGGKIWAESEIDKGSVFYFTLPFIEN